MITLYSNLVDYSWAMADKEKGDTGTMAGVAEQYRVATARGAGARVGSAVMVSCKFVC